MISVPFTRLRKYGHLLSLQCLNVADYWIGLEIKKVDDGDGSWWNFSENLWEGYSVRLYKMKFCIYNPLKILAISPFDVDRSTIVNGSEINSVCQTVKYLVPCRADSYVPKVLRNRRKKSLNGSLQGFLGGTYVNLRSTRHSEWTGWSSHISLLNYLLIIFS